MAKPKKSRDAATSFSDQSSAAAGRRAIHGDNADYGDRVAERAYELYLARGSRDGQDFDDWLSAERELTNGPERQAEPRE